MQNYIVKITNITSLVDAKNVYLNPSYTPGNTIFSIDWQITGTTPLKYKLYRSIGSYPFDPNKDYNVDYTENYKFIADIDAGTTTYDDDLQDLNLNGFSYINNKWVDGSGNDVIRQLVYTKRSIFYKIVAECDDNTVPFNHLPFIYVSYGSTLVCKSVIRQAKFNNYYDETEVVWTCNTGSTINSIAVDMNWQDRKGYVWTVGNLGTVTRIKTIDGSIDGTYSLGYPLYGIRIDPSTGDAIVGGQNQALKRCVLATGAISTLASTSMGTGTYGNYAVTIKNENSTLYAYTIYDKHYVLKWNISNGGSPTVLSDFNYGQFNTQYPTMYSVYGICNSLSNNIWVSARKLVHLDVSVLVQTTSQATASRSYNCGSDSLPCQSRPAASPGNTCKCDYQYDVVSYEWRNYDEKFYTDEGFIYNPETFGVSSLNFQDCARAGHTMYPCAGDNGQHSPAYDVNVYSGQFDGTKADFTGTSSYYIWQADKIEDRVTRINYNSGTLSIPNVTYTITNPINTAVDSENNIWGISQNSNHIKIYQVNASSTFPIGGNCLWPKLTAIDDFREWVYGRYNDPYVEYVLTRNVSDAMYLQIKNPATPDHDKRRLAREWISLSGFNVDGTRVYPNYVAGAYSFARYNSSTSNQPNADETGSEYLMTQGCKVYIESDGDHPAYTLPNIELVIKPTKSTPKLDDNNFWIDQSIYTVSQGCTGYDDLTVSMNASTTNDHSFEISGYDFLYGDRSKDICADSQCNCSSIHPNCGINYRTSRAELSGISFSNIITYKYHDPSESGKPGSRWSGWVGETNGVYTANVTSWADDWNAYVLSGYDEYAGYREFVISTDKTSRVWERWSTPQFYVIPHALDNVRVNWYGTTVWNLYDAYTVGSNTTDIRSLNRITSGYDPLSAEFVDLAVARTWPISSWYINFGLDDNLYPIATQRLSTVYGYEYPPESENRGDNYITYTTSTATVTTSSVEYSKRDAETQHLDFAKHVYFKPGVYYTTIYNSVSNTGTESAVISNGVTDQAILATLSKYVTAQIIVLESEPKANFITISAVTVPDDYIDEYGTVVADPICAAYISTDGSFISGYAPNLTITWQDSSVARSWPISAYFWNFGDYYDELRNTSAFYVDTLYSDYPYWTNNKQNHYSTHTYAIPGVYDVTLYNVASTTSTTSLCTKHLHVYVQEIPHSCGFVTSLSANTGYSNTVLSGTSPLTVYFNPSVIVPGSFPICRIDWSFGDGSEIQTITRKPSNEVFIGPIAYPLDIADPRNVIVSHTFTKDSNASQDTFMVRVSTYSCNTNSMIACSGNYGSYGYNVGPIMIPSTSAVDEDTLIDSLGIDIPKHIISNRTYDNNLLITFEGKRNTSLNYVLSVGDPNV